MRVAAYTLLGMLLIVNAPSREGMADDASVREDTGVFWVSPSSTRSKSSSGLFFSAKSIEVRIHFRANTKTNRWCCAYVSWRGGGEPDLACMILYATSGQPLGKRTIGYRVKVSEGSLAELELWTLDGSKKTALVKTDFDRTGPKTFTTSVGSERPVVRDSADGKVFVVTKTRETKIRQLNRKPRSFHEDDFLLLANKLFEESLVSE